MRQRVSDDIIYRMKIKTYFFLHILLMVYSLSAVLSKAAAGAEFLSPKFLLFYTLIFLILGIYAVGWQQIIKKIPLTTAFANKAVTVVWGLLWGILIFHEAVTLKQFAGAAVVMGGVILFSLSEEESA